MNGASRPANPVVDQIAAARKHAERALRQTAQILDYKLLTHHAGDIRGPIGECVRTFEQTVAHAGCGHLKSPRPCFGLLAQPGVLYCTECGRLVTLQHSTENPDTCDGCGRYARRFREVMVRTGLVILGGHACRRCWAALEGKGAE